MVDEAITYWSSRIWNPQTWQREPVEHWRCQWCGAGGHGFETEAEAHVDAAAHHCQPPPPPAASEADLRAELIAFELYRAQTALPEYVAEAERIVNGYLAARAAAGGGNG